MPLPNQVIQAKNELSSTTPFIWLFELNFGQNVFYFAKNTEDVVYGAYTYNALPIEIGFIRSDDSGKIQSISLSISNIGLALGSIADQLVGASEKQVIIRLMAIINGIPHQVFAIPLTILGATVDEKNVTFELGFKNMLNTKFPLLSFSVNHCQWTFKSVECGYNGTATTCGKRFQDCINFTNFVSSKQGPGPNCRPFGGFPSLRRGVRVVR